jgi:Ca2+-transporting ATPase
VTDGLPALALGVEPYEPDIMKRKPRPPKERVLDRHSLEFILVVGVAIAAMTLYLFTLELPDVARARTMAFTALVILEMAVAISFRAPSQFFGHELVSNKKMWVAILSSLLLQLVIVYVPFFQPIFDTVPLSFGDWMRVLVAAFTIFIAIEINKVLKVHRHVYRVKDVHDFVRGRNK